jgi:hypothetical protein
MARCQELGSNSGAENPHLEGASVLSEFVSLCLSLCHTCRVRLTLPLAVVLIAAPGVMASPLREVAATSVAFSSDGARYAAWQAPRDTSITLLDTQAGRQRQIEPPTGCRLHDEAEDGEPIASAAAGRFLLACGDGATQALLDVHTDRTIQLPKKSNGTSDWYRVGARYVMGVNILYDIATGAKFRLNTVADLDRPGASTRGICAAVRRLVTHNPWDGWRKGYAFQGALFAQRLGTQGNVQLNHCHGRPTILHARGGPAVCKGEPLHFDLRGGLLSWDTGCEGELAEPDERHFHGRLYSYTLAGHRRDSWPLPWLTVRGGGEPITARSAIPRIQRTRSSGLLREHSTRKNCFTSKPRRCTRRDSSAKPRLFQRSQREWARLHRVNAVPAIGGLP